MWDDKSKLYVLAINSANSLLLMLIPEKYELFVLTCDVVTVLCVTWNITVGVISIPHKLLSPIAILYTAHPLLPNVFVPVSDALHVLFDQFPSGSSCPQWTQLSGADVWWYQKYVPSSNWTAYLPVAFPINPLPLVLLKNPSLPSLFFKKFHVQPGSQCFSP